MGEGLKPVESGNPEYDRSPGFETGSQELPWVLNCVLTSSFGAVLLFKIPKNLLPAAKTWLGSILWCLRTTAFQEKGWNLINELIILVLI